MKSLAELYAEKKDAEKAAQERYKLIAEAESVAYVRALLRISDWKLSTVRVNGGCGSEPSVDVCVFTSASFRNLDLGEPCVNQPWWIKNVNIGYLGREGSIEIDWRGAPLPVRNHLLDELGRARLEAEKRLAVLSRETLDAKKREDDARDLIKRLTPMLEKPKKRKKK